MSFEFEFNKEEYPDKKLNQSIYEILSGTELLSMASINEDKSHINTAYFAFNSSLELFILTPPTSKHTENLEKNNSVAVTVFDTNQRWNGDKKGLQLFGKYEKTEGDKFAEGMRFYLQRFPAFSEWVETAEELEKSEIDSRIYMITVNSLKLFDEPMFGKDEFISLKISR